MQFPHELYKKAGLLPADVAALCDVSRVTGWRWMRGEDNGAEVGVNLFLRDRVARVTANVKQALDAGALPDVTLVNLPARERASKLKTILRQNRPSK